MNGLAITQVTIQKDLNRSESDPCLALARLVFNECFVINNIKIVKGKFGLFVSFPRTYDPKKKAGWNICYPITKLLHETITEKILSEYRLSL